MAIEGIGQNRVAVDFSSQESFGKSLENAKQAFGSDSEVVFIKETKVTNWAKAIFTLGIFGRETTYSLAEVTDKTQFSEHNSWFSGPFANKDAKSLIKGLFPETSKHHDVKLEENLVGQLGTKYQSIDLSRLSKLEIRRYEQGAMKTEFEAMRNHVFTLQKELEAEIDEYYGNEDHKELANTAKEKLANRLQNSALMNRLAYMEKVVEQFPEIVNEDGNYPGIDIDGIVSSFKEMQRTVGNLKYELFICWQAFKQGDTNLESVSNNLTENSSNFTKAFGEEDPALNSYYDKFPTRKPTHDYDDQVHLKHTTVRDTRPNNNVWEEFGFNVNVLPNSSYSLESETLISDRKISFEDYLIGDKLRYRGTATSLSESYDIQQ